MPNRILKETICTSPEIHELTPEEETLFYRLIVKCDDFGRFDARPKIVRGMALPLRDVSEGTIQGWLDKLEEVGLIKRYVVDGLPYLQLVTWHKHQKVRTPREKYPPSPELVPGEVF